MVRRLPTAGAGKTKGVICLSFDVPVTRKEIKLHVWV